MWAEFTSRSSVGSMVRVVGSRSMNRDQLKSRLHDAMHRGSHNATEEELAEVTAVVLAIVGEVTAEMAVLIADLEERVAALESRGCAVGVTSAPAGWRGRRCCSYAPRWRRRRWPCNAARRRCGPRPRRRRRR